MAKDTIQLQIDGTSVKTETVAEWQAETFVLDGAARGTSAAPPLIDIPIDSVIELELGNGPRILVAAADVERYLGKASAREGSDTTKSPAIQVRQTLHLSGSRLPTTSRDGLGAWILKGLCIYRQGPVSVAALVAAGRFQDARLEDRSGLYRCSTGKWELSKVDTLPSSSEPILLFLHGTASSSEGSFGGLWYNTDYRRKLVDIYGSRIYAFEHRSLTDSPIKNALDLIKTLPKGACLHLVSHSRGGLVGELLARANRVGEKPFTSSEIKRFLQHGSRTGREKFKDDAKRLEELSREMISRAIRVERFVRVACPARGTTLAAGKLDRWASVMLNLFGKGIDLGAKTLPFLEPVAKGYDLLQGFLLALVRERTDARILPGLEAMMPDSPLVALLNDPEVKIDFPLHTVAGDFQGAGLLPWLGDCLSEVYYGGQTDLVVNTPSMSGGAARMQGIRQKSLAGPKVHHLSYFRRDESALPIINCLGGNDRDFVLLEGPSQATISRGGRKTKPKADAPIAFILPGIMGSHIQLGSDRIWFDPFSMCTGGMDKLKVEAKNVSPDGWMDLSYEKLARYLTEKYEVRPFAYDWRLSITAAATLFGKELDKAIKDAKKRGKPLRIVAHSMGGLVARLALKTRWQEFKSLPGSRLLQLGTPNRGSHSIAAVLTARDDFIQTIERWFDWKHDMREFLEIVSEFPGVLELLPWPEENGLAIDGLDYFSEETWLQLYNEDSDSKKATSWLAPKQTPLTAARAAIEALRQADLDPECTLYVAGQSPTPIGVRVEKGQVQIGWTDEGDGRVPWKTGIPAGVPVWYTDASHGDLANHTKAFDAYLELLETGSTRRLSRSPSTARTVSAPVFKSRSLTGNGLYPSVEEVLAAAIGGAKPGKRAETTGEVPATVEVIHGSLAAAESPILIGSYTADSLRGSAKFLNGLLSDRLQEAHAIGRYPCRPEDAMVFRQSTRNRKPAGAIVVGLGPIGELLPGTLTRAITHGLLEYARCSDQLMAIDPEKQHQLEVSSVLVGTGFTGLSVEAGTRCLIDALRRTNLALAQGKLNVRIGRLTIFEEMESRAITAVESLRDLLGESRFANAATFEGRLRDGHGGYCGRQFTGSEGPGAYRVHIVADKADKGALRFTVVTDRARNEVSAEPDQRQAVDGLLLSATGTTHDQPGLSRALFELLVPNTMKELVADLRTLTMSMDEEAAAYPWELMRDTDQPDEPPLAVRVELVRQLASPHGRGRVPTVQEKRVFIVGDTQSGLNELPGAQAEARTVADCFEREDYEIYDIYRATSVQVFEALFNGHYRFMHLAGHGVVKDKETERTGMVLGPETYLTSAQISKLRHVPEFIFINCCHLGSMAPELKTRTGELAANLATQCIEMGCKAVIAAGWAVDDQAASTFARTFYEAMFKGYRFARAVQLARIETYRLHPGTNTWGAFQAYGDDRYRFPGSVERNTSQKEYVHPSHIIADLEKLSARIKDATQQDKKDYYLDQLKAIEEAARGTDFQHAGVREALAVAWAELNDRERAIGHYRAALSLEDAGLSLHGLEQLANLEIREGSTLLGDKDTNIQQKGEAYMQAGWQRLNLLLAMGPTIERLSMLASYWKRKAQAYKTLGKTEQISECLLGMQDGYWRAAEMSYQRTGLWDYYPLLNALDGAFLSAACGERDLFDARQDQLPELLAAAAEDGRRRFNQSRQFFHAMAAVEAERIRALWGCYQEKKAAFCLTDPEVRQQIAERYRDLLKRLGSPREQDSATNQLDFLIAFLPSDKKGAKVKEALQQLITDIRNNEE
ncbi:CHAT domain-containing protein [Desulfopila aestuarii]|uniref:Lecithin:cholesterol acyltransferase n=1 Tax=Desulfopila aestuarii DSM 18488 TaxID=1121416 RepID=A0A1M7Y8R8_9BACT|nr:CHAT domain-containing protein [Desulfopila aestuarii]SHO49033.1 Lecithin:cholesterol acyltransferase [Desulfopila aestuarii DSM 18488]